MRKRKYRPGEKISTLSELAEQEFVYWNDKITPRGWFMSWQMQMAKRAIEMGIIRKAERVEGDG